MTTFQSIIDNIFTTGQVYKQRRHTCQLSSKDDIPVNFQAKTTYRSSYKQRWHTGQLLRKIDIPVKFLSKDDIPVDFKANNTK